MDGRRYVSAAANYHTMASIQYCWQTRSEVKTKLAEDVALAFVHLQMAVNLMHLLLKHRPRVWLWLPPRPVTGAG
jgi:hypothetical protein